VPQDLKARTKLAVSGQFNALDLNQAPKFGFGCECNTRLLLARSSVHVLWCSLYLVL